MNPNRQNNCFVPAGAGCVSRPGNRPAVVQVSCPVNPVPCCNNAAPTSAVPCCSDVVSGGIIIGGCANQSCDKETILSGAPIAMAYVPWQSYGNLCPMPQALRIGTLFQELNLDFAGRRCN